MPDDKPPVRDQAPPGIYDESGRPRFFADAGVDRLVSVVLQLTSEVWVLAERLSNLEQLAQRKGYVTHDEIRNYQPDSTEAQARDTERDRFVRSVLGPVREPRVSEESPAPPAARS
jgi:hypothetical protein